MPWGVLGGPWGGPGGDSKRNLAQLGSIFGALATLKIELPSRRELNFHVFTVLPFKTAF